MSERIKATPPVKSLLCLFLVLSVFASIGTAASPKANAAYYLRDFLTSDNDSVYCVSVGSSFVSVNMLAPSERTVNIPLSHSFIFLKIRSGYIYLSQAYHDADSTICVSKYSSDGVHLEDFIYYCSDTPDEYSMDISDDEIIYMRDVKNPQVLIALDFDGNVLQRTKLSSPISRVFAENSSSAVAFGENNVFIIKNGSVRSYSINTNQPLLKKIGEDCYLSADGRLYSIGSSVNEIEISAPEKPYADLAAVGDGLLCFCSGRDLYYKRINGTELYKRSLTVNPQSLQIAGGSIFVLDDDSNIYEVGLEEFERLSQTDEPAQSTDASASGSGGDYYINSDAYYINTDDMIIEGVKPSTAVKDFKANIDHNFESFTLKKPSGETVTSGKAATTMTASFEAQGESLDFTVIVSADVSCDGSANSTDEQLILSLLFEEIEFNEYQTLAGDLNSDGEVSLADLILFSRLK